MSKEIGCDACDKEATVHLTQIINGKVHKVDLCEECAQNLGVTDPNGFSVSDLLAKDLLKDVNPEKESAASEICLDCGCSKQQFRKSGRFGCPTCYETFSSALAPILKSIHAGTQHTGKVPQQNLKPKPSIDLIHDLEHKLREAISREEYEIAATLRDQLAELKSGDSSNPLSSAET